jgi:hypothetical protein
LKVISLLVFVTHCRTSERNEDYGFDIFLDAQEEHCQTIVNFVYPVTATVNECGRVSQVLKKLGISRQLKLSTLLSLIAIAVSNK